MAENRKRYGVLHFENDARGRSCHYWFYESVLNEKACHSPFSSDLGRSHFDLFEKMKTMLIRMMLEDKNELLASVSDVLTTILPGSFRWLLRNVC
jgi:hypothetical protein